MSTVDVGFGDPSSLLAWIRAATSAPEVTRDELIAPAGDQLRRLTLDTPVVLQPFVPWIAEALERSPAEIRAVANGELCLDRPFPDAVETRAAAIASLLEALTQHRAALALAER